VFYIHLAGGRCALIRPGALFHSPFNQMLAFLHCIASFTAIVLHLPAFMATCKASTKVATVSVLQFMPTPRPWHRTAWHHDTIAFYISLTYQLYLTQNQSKQYAQAFLEPEGYSCSQLFLQPETAILANYFSDSSDLCTGAVNVTNAAHVNTRMVP
jgi:hypothetical protein